MRFLKWLVTPFIALGLILGGTGTANALEIKNRHIKMIPYHGSQSIYTCYYEYNWYEELVLGYDDGPRSGAACRR